MAAKHMLDYSLTHWADLKRTYTGAELDQTANIGHIRSVSLITDLPYRIDERETVQFFEWK